MQSGAVAAAFAIAPVFATAAFAGKGGGGGGPYAPSLAAIDFSVS